MRQAPQFPPLFAGLEVEGAISPFEKACAMAALGCDAGTIPFRIRADLVEAAIVFAPEVPLARATAMLIACGVGFSNALGALAPPEVGVHLHWDGRIRVNGGLCGNLSMAASHKDPATVPDWLVIGLSVPLLPADPERPGQTPEHTSLFDEGCVEVAPETLLEAWSRHTLVWVNRWEDEGAAPLHAEWRGMARDIGDAIEAPDGRGRGTFMGVDEDFGMLLRDGETTRALPLSLLLT